MKFGNLKADYKSTDLFDLIDIEKITQIEISRQSSEYERTSTTVINAYIRPVVKDYLENLNNQLANLGFKVPLTIMQSNGGLSPVNLAIEKPIFCIESGPAAGVVGAFHLGNHIGTENFMTFDMGGTTAKASIIENGEMLLDIDLSQKLI